MSNERTQCAPESIPVEPEPPSGHSNPAVHYTDKRPLRRYFRWYFLLNAAFAMAIGATTTVLLPNQVQLLEVSNFFFGADAGIDLQALTNLKLDVADGVAVATADQERQLDLLAQFEQTRANGLAMITTVGAVIAMFSQPLIGVISDRTRSRMGRRAPWILYGGLIGAVLLLGIRYAPAVGVVVVLWALFNIAINLVSTPLFVTLADRVPDDQRGTGSAAGGVGTMLGGILGGVAAGGLFALIGLEMYFAAAVALALIAVLFVLRNRDKSSEDMAVAPFAWGTFLRGFLVPLRDSDFRWVWTARVLIFFGSGVSGALSFFVLQSYVQPALSAAEATALAPLLGLIGIPLTMIAVAISGRLSDKVGRRKPFIIAASFVMAFSMLIPLVSPTLPAVIAQALIGATAFGFFLPVDQALIVDVLPDQDSAGRDLGIANMASNLGQSLAPIVASQVFVITGGYHFIWVTAFVLVAAAALAIIPVTRVR